MKVGQNPNWGNRTAKDPLDLHQRMTYAVDLLRAGIMPRIVAFELNLKAPRVRSIHMSLFGRGSRSGVLPAPHTLLATQAGVIEASIAMQIYLRFGGHAVLRQTDLKALLATDRVFGPILNDLRIERHLDVNHLWILAKELRSRSIRITSCSGCEFPYVWLEVREHDQRCPFCGAAPTPAAAIARSYRRTHRHKGEALTLQRLKDEGVQQTTC